MFLVTTPDERAWKKDEKILFLGEWCKLYERKQIWSQLDYLVAPYHWDNRKQLFKDFKYLNDIYEKYLALYAGKLNEVHGCEHSVRYWRIIIGPWFRYYVEVLYDRYITVIQARDRGDVSSTWLLQSDPSDWVPYDSGQLYKYAISDSWNVYMYGEIIKFLGGIPYTEKKIKNLPPEVKQNVNQIIVPKTLLKILRLYSRLLPEKWKKIVFFASGFGDVNAVRLSLKLGQVPFWLPDIDFDHVEVEKQTREKLKVSSADSEFELILEKLTPMQVPKIYLEGFVNLRDKILRNFPQQPKIIFTANAYNSNDIFKIWAAEKTAHDTKLLITQHGGNFGTSLWEQSEDHQVLIADKFYIWGRSNREEKTLKTMPAGKLVRAKNQISAHEKGSILMVLAGVPRYSYRMFSHHVAPQFLDYISYQIAFMEKLSQPVQNKLNVRLYSLDHKWGVEQRIRDKGLGHLIDTNNHSYRQALNKSRLCVSTYNSTTYLETFVADYPTLMFWNPGHWELRTKAQPYFDSLRQVGILHDTPETAAILLNEIYEDPKAWWQQPEVQAAKDEFCDAFANTGKDWINEWKAELNKIVK
ncbi:MAG: hypothetical protein HQL71_11645 [Magnetococcales bacterium]|nr:hypothetical protein [Magnetococcales bacterium]